MIKACLEFTSSCYKSILCLCHPILLVRDYNTAMKYAGVGFLLLKLSFIVYVKCKPIKYRVYYQIIIHLKTISFFKE